MKLSTWAKKQGISYLTAWRWIKTNKFPLPFSYMPSGTIIIHETPLKENLPLMLMLGFTAVFPHMIKKMTLTDKSNDAPISVPLMAGLLKKQ